jgi:hypothetical protein
MQAIVTKYLPPSNTRGSRIRATADAGSVTILFPADIDGQAAHRVAAQALADKLGWGRKYLGGSLPDNTGYVFVPVHPISEE